MNNADERLARAYRGMSARADTWRKWLDDNGFDAADFTFGPFPATEAWTVACACVRSALAARGLDVLAITATMVGMAEQRAAVITAATAEPTLVPQLLGLISIRRARLSPPALPDKE